METGPPAPPPRPARPRPKMAPGPPPPRPLANGVAEPAAGRGAPTNEGAEETRRRPGAANEELEGRGGSEAAAGVNAGATEAEAGSTTPEVGSTEAGAGSAAANEGSEPCPRSAAAILRSVEATAGAEAGGRSRAAAAGSTEASVGSAVANQGSTAANEEPEAHGRSMAANAGSTAAVAGSTVANAGSTVTNEEAEAHGRSMAANAGSTAAISGSTVANAGSMATNEEAEAHGRSMAANVGSTAAILGSTAAVSGPTTADLGSTAANEEPEANGRSMEAILGSTAANMGPTAANGGSTAANGGSAVANGGSTVANGGTTAANGGSKAANEEPESRTTSTAAILEPSPPAAAPETPAAGPAAVSEPSAAPPAAVSGSPGERSLAGADGPGRGSQGSLGPGIPGPRGADLDSVSLLSGTLESLAGPFPDDASSMGSDSEVAAPCYPRTDRYGFLGGSQYCKAPDNSVPVDVARQRELKWLEMFNHWDKWLSRRYQKVKLRCRKGIPSSLRARAWQLLSDSKALLDRNPGLFQELERQPGDPRWLDAIEKDLHRQFPFHEMFAARGGHGQQDLYRILKAYTVYRPQEGYCQAQAPVAAVLLMHMPAEQAFWCLVQICEKYLPGYYSAGLEAVQLDGEVFGALLRRAAPAAHRHLRHFRVEPVLYLTEWFMCIFARSLPWAAVLRVWDMFFCEGAKVLFRVGLVLLRLALGSPEQLRRCQGVLETMERLRSVPPPGLHEDALVLQVTSVPVTEALLEREVGAQLRRWRETRGELRRPPPPRLHGARAILGARQRGGADGDPAPPRRPAHRGEGAREDRAPAEDRAPSEKGEGSREDRAPPQKGGVPTQDRGPADQGGGPVEDRAPAPRGGGPAPPGDEAPPRLGGREKEPPRKEGEGPGGAPRGGGAVAGTPPGGRGSRGLLGRYRLRLPGAGARGEGAGEGERRRQRRDPPPPEGQRDPPGLQDTYF